MSAEKEQFEKVMGELRRSCLPTGAADVIQAYVNAQGGALEHLRTERRHDAQIQAAMAADQTAVAEALGIPPGEYSGGAGEQLLAIEKLREALARVEAERDRLAKRLCICHSCGGRGEVHTGQYTDEGQWQPPEPVMVECGECGGDGQIGQVIDLDTAQAQLAEAVGLLGDPDHGYAHGWYSSVAKKVADFLARYSQAEQQEAEPVPVEVQGAQAGDEARNSAFEKHWYEQKATAFGSTEAQRHFDAGWQARTALATQPAPRECNCPKIGERFSAEKHGGPCPVHDAVRGAEHE